MPYWQWSCSIILLWNHHIFIQNAVTKSYLWLKYKFTVFDLIWSNRLQIWLNCTKPFCSFPQVKIPIHLNAQWKPEVAASNHHTFLCANYIRNNFLHDPSYLGENYKALWKVECKVKICIKLLNTWLCDFWPPSAKHLFDQYSNKAKFRFKVQECSQQFKEKTNTSALT